MAVTVRGRPTVGHPWEIDLRDWAAYDPLGNNDSTTPIQAALTQAIAVGNGTIRGADVKLGPGRPVTTDTLTIPPAAAQYSAVSLIGHSPGTTQIQYNGPTDGRPAILGDKFGYSHMGNFALVRSVSSRGTSVGIRFSATSGVSGTQTLSNLMYPLMIQGFYQGIYLGAGASPYLSAASEFIFQWTRVDHCDYGIYLQSQNSLNFAFPFLEMAFCGYGLYSSTAGQIFIGVGGVAAANDNTTADVYFGVNEGRNALCNLRSERCNRVLVAAGGGVILDNIEVADWVSGHDGIGVEGISGLYAAIRNCRLNGGKVTAATGQLVIENSTLGGSQYLNPNPAQNLYQPSLVVAMNSDLNDGALGTAGTSTGPLAVYAVTPANVMRERYRINTDGFPSFHGATGQDQAAVGAAADGTLADLTTKYNALRAALVARGDLKA